MTTDPAIAYAARYSADPADPSQATRLAAYSAGWEDRARTAASCASDQPMDRDLLAAMLADRLSGTYHCLRVWDAWHIGTMSQDDFADVGESDTPGEIADEIMSMIVAPATVRDERTDAATVADTLESYNSWRRGNADGLEQPHPALIGGAIDKAVAMLRADVPEGCTPADARHLRDANHALAAEVQMLRVDAERYRWLRENADIQLDRPATFITNSGHRISARSIARDEVDRAVDAARTAQQGDER